MSVSCDTTTPAPPNSAVWYDLDATAADVLAVLRLTDTDVDADRIRAIIPAVAGRFDQFFDRVEAIPGPPPLPSIQEALVHAVCEEYRRKDPNVAVDPVAVVRPELAPHKQRWGVA